MEPVKLDKNTIRDMALKDVPPEEYAARCAEYEEEVASRVRAIHETIGKFRELQSDPPAYLALAEKIVSSVPEGKVKDLMLQSLVRIRQEVTRGDKNLSSLYVIEPIKT